SDALPARCPSSRFPMITEVNNATRSQRIKSHTGTTAGFPCKRTGEYDVALKGYIALIYRYAVYLAPDTRYRIMHLLNKGGPHDPADDTYCGLVGINETENHRLMIETSRYLTNQLLARTSSDPSFANTANGMDAFILGMLQEFMQHDFIEYNSRPYSRYAFTAIQNLYDYARPQNGAVHVAAQMVLDYLSAKVAVSANDARRNPPYRRRQSHAHDDLFHP